MTFDHILRELPFPDHVQAALAEGKLWRAKEILRGRVGTMPYDTGLYEQYGVVLCAMHDELQGGKYLFLSGARRPEYEAAIGEFLRRHGKRLRRDLIASFPAKARSVPLADFPAVVQAELIARGLPNEPAQPLNASEKTLGSFLSGAIFIGCLLFAALGFASMLVGLPIIFRALLSVFD